MEKKKILFHSNHSKAYTGFGKNAKNVLKHLFATGKYEIVEFSNGLPWSHEKVKKLPWKAYGSLPDDPALIQQLNRDPQLGRAAGYGANMIDKIIQQEKPDVYIGAEDIWAFNGYMEKEWWNKTNCMIWTTLDSLPILPDAIAQAPNIKNYYVWASFAEKELKRQGHSHVKTLHGSIDCSTFFRMEDQERANLRALNNIHHNSYVIGFVFRNQLRKSVPNLLEGFKMFLQQEPQSNAKLLLHTNWAEGWDIPRLIKEKNINPNQILTTYKCSSCKNYEIKPFSGQNQQCKFCGEKKSSTTSTTNGISEEQLNEIYNLMDVYCHPFTSGGQEIPVQEAKLTELITLVTNYSCGEDSCGPDSGGFPLEWSEYREPGTQFIKASTHPSSILKNLKKVFRMKPDKKRKQEKKSRDFVLENYDTKIIGKKLESIIDEMPSISWDFDFSFKKRNPLYNPPNIENDSEWVSDLYKNVLMKNVDEKDNGHQHWIQRLNTDMNRQQVLDYFRSVAQKENNENNKIDLKDVFIDSEHKKGIIVCSGDHSMIFAATSIFSSFHDTYPDTDLYFACHPQFHSILNGNPHIKKVLPYHDAMDKELFMIGNGKHNGFVDYYINLNNSILKNISAINA